MLNSVSSLPINTEKSGPVYQEENLFLIAENP